MFDQTSDPAKLGFDPDRLARIRAWMQRWVDQGKFPGAQTLIARHGEIAYCDWVGSRDVENGLSWERDTIVRIYSMTKPIAAVALLLCYEDALVHLDTPVDQIIPEFADRQVLIEGATSLDQVRPATTRMTVHHLLTHTSGLTYSFNEGVLAAEMLEQKLDFGVKREVLAHAISRLAGLPLAFDPGARWNYGVSIDVIGRIVEIVSGLPLDRFLAERIFAPLEMTDTAFDIAPEKEDRFAACYVKTDEDPRKLMDTARDSAYAAGKVSMFSGGGGLVSTAADYLKFAEMLRRKGALGGARLLAPNTVDIMTANALGGDLASMGQPVFSEVSFDGIGFGLGVSVNIDPGRAKTSCSLGDFGWGGMASTNFWVDPVENMVAIFLTQLVPSSSYPNRKEVRAMVYSSLTNP